MEISPYYFSHPEYEKIREKFAEVYTIPEIIEILKEAKLHREQLWFENLKKRVSEFYDILDNTPEDLKAQLLKYLNIMQCMALATPRIFHLIKSALIFNLEIFEYINVTRLGQLKELDLDVQVLSFRIVTTVVSASFQTLITNRSKIFGQEPWDLPPFQSKSKTLYKSAWNEFMEFLQTQKEVVKPADNLCLIS